MKKLITILFLLISGIASAQIGGNSAYKLRLADGRGTSSRVAIVQEDGSIAPLANGPNDYYLSLVAGVPQWVVSSGGVSSFSSGNLSPLFTTNVATATSTPALTFTISEQTQNLIFASPNGSTGAPSFRAFHNNDLPTSGVVAGSYTNSDITVNSKGIITAIANGSTSGLDTASTTVLGGVKIDGTSITISSGGVISAPTSGGGTVVSVTGAAPITSTGGVTPEIGITAATTSAAGSLSAADKTKLDGLAAQVNSDWNAVSGVAQILNKPSIMSSWLIKVNGVYKTAITDNENVDFIGTGGIGVSHSYSFGVDQLTFDGSGLSYTEGEGIDITSNVVSMDINSLTTNLSPASTGYIPYYQSGTNRKAPLSYIGDIPIYNAAKLQDFSISTTDPTTNQVLQFNGTSLVWATLGTGGTVTSFSAGDLSPLFTTSEATVTTTPALSFTLSNAAAYTVFGNQTGSTAAPSYGKLNINSLSATGTPSATTFLRGDGTWDTPANTSKWTRYTDAFSNSWIYPQTITDHILIGGTTSYGDYELQIVGNSKTYGTSHAQYEGGFSQYAIRADSNAPIASGYFSNTGTGGGIQSISSSSYGGKLEGVIGVELIGTQSAMKVTFNTAPASATASGSLGEIRVTADYIYVCTATNTWKRVAIATW